MIYLRNTVPFIRYIFFTQLQRKLFPLLIFLLGIAALGQSKIDSLTVRIERTDSQAEKARLQLERAVLYNKSEREKAFANVDSALEYYTGAGNKKGETDSYIAYGNLHFLYGDPLRAAHFDSIAIQLAEKIQYEKGRAAAIGNLAREFIRSGNFKKAEKHIQRAIELEMEFMPQDRERLAELYNRYSVMSAAQGNLINSLTYIEKAMELSENSKNEKLLSLIYNNYANTLSRLSKFDESVKIHFKVIRLCEKHKDTIGLLRAYNNLGIVFRNVGEFDKAIAYYKKNIVLATKFKDYKSLGLSSVNLATVYSAKEQYEAMDTLYDQGIKYFEMASDLGGIALANHNYGNFLLLNKNYPKADSSLLKAYELRKQIGATRRMASSLAVLGKSALEQKKMDMAEKYLLEAEAIYSESGQGDRSLKELYGYLNQLYSENGDYKKAFEYQAKELELERTLFTESEKINTLKTETAYELEKRDLALALEKETQQKNKLQIIFISAGIVTLLLVSILFLWLRRRQNKERHEAQVRSLNQEHRLNVTEVLKKTEQEERKKIAHKLHDEVGSMLSIAILNTKQMRKNLFKPGDNYEKKLEATEKILVDISSNVRNISHTLMPVALEKQGLKAAIHEFVEAINISEQIKIEEIIEGLDDTSLWSEEFCLALYRIVQEVMNNIIKHAQATNVLLQIVELEDSVTIYIEDNGKGLDQELTVDGIGLKLLKNNIAYLNGTIEISGQKNTGTFILAELPIESKTRNKISVL